MNQGIRAIHELALMGYRASAKGKNIQLLYEREGDPESAKVAPLIELVKEHKEAVLLFLKCYCPRCGGIMTIPDHEGNPLCAKCYWPHLVQLYPGLDHKQ